MGPPHALSATKLLSLFCFYILLATQAADAKIQRDKWEENYRFKSPDCHKKLAIAINGRTTGPQSSRNKATLLSTEGLMAHKYQAFLQLDDNSVFLLREDCGIGSPSIDGYSQLLVAIRGLELVIHFPFVPSDLSISRLSCYLDEETK
ncbi:hypothetical protein AAC387_Pa01g3492 [Persea americana]